MVTINPHTKNQCGSTYPLDVICSYWGYLNLLETELWHACTHCLSLSECDVLVQLHKNRVHMIHIATCHVVACPCEEQCDKIFVT